MQVSAFTRACEFSEFLIWFVGVCISDFKSGRRESSRKIGREEHPERVKGYVGLINRLKAGFDRSRFDTVPGASLQGSIPPEAW